MSDINQQLIDNISIILKKSLAADATLADLRANDKAKFKSIFTTDSAFSVSADTFQPYVEELADDLVRWQQSQSQTTLVAMVKKIEQLFAVLGQFESSYSD
ncbi:hypothetical protein [Thalassotalea agarivorans]|uniref:Prephenate dehydrogenase n=1 Tax=Thalassotalea agarivorans TaxID=349064 RepID=A0A1I0GL96_THASX|nr:hypothetical protein [Thalassotalea agarivorans]SET71824.1 hypothetical protein SAMN05660429_02493 [Thalassotalea agarivorans]